MQDQYDSELMQLKDEQRYPYRTWWFKYVLLPLAFGFGVWGGTQGYFPFF